MITATLGTIAMDSVTPDADGVVHHLTKLEGWDGPAFRQTFDDITSMDGVALGEAQYAGRPLVLGGIAKAPSEAAYWAAYNRLVGLNLIFAEAALTVTEGAVAKQLAVRTTGPPRIAFGVGSTSFGFELSLVAAYPIKLETADRTLAYNGSIAPVNGGSYLTWPVITMTSSGTPTFTNTSVGNTVGFTGSLPSGTVIDFRKRTIISPGNVDEYPKLDVAADDWWPLMVGTNNLTRGGTGNATIAWRYAWL